MSGLRSGATRVAESVRVSGVLWTASLILDRLVPWGVLGRWRDRTISPDLLAAQLDVVLRAWGMAPAHVAITVEHVLWADLHGIDSHGCSMFLDYHRKLVAGSVTMTPTVSVVRESDTTALVDGGGGLGHVPGDTAMKLAIAKCRAAGVGVVAVRNSGHFGAAGSYASMATAAGFVGLATTNTQQPSVVPTSGVEAKLGTNPIAFGAPAASRRPFLLDMATSTASLGKLVMAWRKGRSIPVGWALGPNGSPVRSGRVGATQRQLTPLGATAEMGSHKGYGLAAMVEILSGILPGHRPGEGHVGHFFLALDPARFRDQGSFGDDLDVLIDSLHACPPADGAGPVLVAGDPEWAAFADRRRDGIPLSRSVIEDLRTIAHAARAPFLLDGRK